MAANKDITMEQYELLKGICRKNWRGNPSDLEDYTTDVVCDVLTHWQKYDSDKGAFSTWAWYRSMKIRDRWNRKMKRTPTSNAQSIPWDEVDSMIGGHERIHATATLSSLMDKAPEIVRDAILAQGLGLSSSETREVLGISGQSKTQRIKRWVKQLEQNQ